MRDQSIWSIGIGRWLGLHVRIHMFFLLFAACSLYMGWYDAKSDSDGGVGWTCPAAIGILLLSVLLHELGHVCVAWHLQGNIDEIVIGPLGGLGNPPAMPGPDRELAATIAGPLVNLGICVATSIAICVQGNIDLAGLMNPFAPGWILVGTPLVVLLKLTFWINWLLVLVNLIPAFPFDGARLVRAFVLTGWPRVEPRAASLLAVRLAKVTAVVLMVIAIFLFGQVGKSSGPAWFALLLLGIFIFFSARNEERQPPRSANDDLCLGYDFSEGYTSLERSSPQNANTKIEKAETGPIAGWLQRRREHRARRLREIEADEDGRVDEILARVHELGYQSLTSEEQAILQRASVRYQKRKSE